MPYSSSHTEISEKIIRWMQEENDIWKHIIIEDEKFFNIKVIKNNRSIHLLMDGIHDRVLLVAKTNPTQEQKKAFSLLSELSKQQTCSDLLILLYQLGVLPQLFPLYQKDTIEYIELQKVIYFDGVTKDKLFDALSTVLRSIETINEVFNKLHTISNNNDLPK